MTRQLVCLYCAQSVCRCGAQRYGDVVDLVTASVDLTDITSLVYGTYASGDYYYQLLAGDDVQLTFVLSQADILDMARRYPSSPTWSIPMLVNLQLRKFWETKQINDVYVFLTDLSNGRLPADMLSAIDVVARRY